MHAKSDAEVTAVRPAITHSNVELLTNAEAVRLETNPAGTAVTEVVVGGQLRDLLGKSAMIRKIHHLRGHVIICGYGRFGKSGPIGPDLGESD